MREFLIYNTMHQKKEIFQPRDKERVRMYACGVTVYDHCHIGHGRSLFMFSLLKRVLEEIGYRVKFVRNITDIDDKIINRIWEENGHRQISLNELNAFVDKFISSYYDDLTNLGLPRADFEPRATEYIDKMIGFIQRLMDLGYAYVTEEGNVYYSVKNFRDYGKLSHRNVDELLKGVRKDVEEDKRNPLDFALWKAAKPNEPYWESPWGPGRPGWHLECAVMSTDILDGGFDIHGGGRDLIFPHHENEIAEAEAVLGEEFARYWVHHGMVTVNGEKMSKSVGNFITLKEALKRYPAHLWRLWYLTAHYRSPIDFSEDKMQEIAKMQDKISLWYGLLQKNKEKDDLDLGKKAEKLYTMVLGALCDDLNTPKALGILFSVISETMDKLKEGKGSNSLLEAADKVFSVMFIDPAPNVRQPALDDDLVDLVLRARAALRKYKEFAIADEIRDALKKRGIIVEDTPSGSRWMRR